jgi:hypothetical protein
VSSSAQACPSASDDAKFGGTYKGSAFTLTEPTWPLGNPVDHRHDSFQSLGEYPLSCSEFILEYLMPTERLSAIGEDGITYVVVCKRPRFPVISRTSSKFDMASYQLEDGRELSPTGALGTFRTVDGTLVLRLG